jgi:hypothetical protein
VLQEAEERLQAAAKRLAQASDFAGLHRTVVLRDWIEGDTFVWLIGAWILGSDIR